MSISSLYTKVVNWVVLSIGKVHWVLKTPLYASDISTLKKDLTDNYFIILTRRRNHLSTFFTSVANLILTGKWGYWSHAFMNLEDEVNNVKDFRLVEAIGTGVKYSTFDETFDVNAVVLLKPVNMPIESWTAALDKCKSEVGKPYDSLFNIKNDNELSCVELVRTALMATPDYEKNFANFEKMIAEHKNLTPQMFYDCADFEIVYQVRR